MAKVYALFDPDGTGKIGFRELKRVVTELGESISDEEMREMIEEADRDKDGASAAARGHREISPTWGLCIVERAQGTSPSRTSSAS